MLLFWLGDIVAGYPADLVVAPGTIGPPKGVAIDPVARTLFISDSANNRILRYDNIDTLQTGTPPSSVLGQPNFTSIGANQNTNPSAFTLSAPVGICIDSAGTLWVADGGNNRVLWYLNASQLSNGAPANGFLGQPSFTIATVRFGQFGMNIPQDVSVIAGVVWVADASNNRFVLSFLVI